MGVAQESDQVKKAREKLKRQFEEETKLITPEALKEVQDKIYRWIERHSRERVNLRERNIAQYTLFDTNEHPAKTTSKFVQRLKSQLITELPGVSEEAVPDRSLRGRIKRVDS
ncbi:MAG: hypothetical protein ACI9S8_000722 [Chlamydiales bacterium]|jgi:hypothetical protein